MMLPLPLGPIDIVEVYVEHDEPLLYLAKNSRGEMFLSVLAEDLDEEQVWYFAPMSKRRTEDVRAGLIDLHDAFARAEHGMIVALHRPRGGDGVDRVELLVAESISEERLPRPDKRLRIERDWASIPNVREIATSQRRVVAALRFIPRVRSEKEVGVAPFANVLFGVQGSLHAIGEHLATKNAKPRKGRPKKNEPKPPDPFAETRFKAADRFAASFGIELHSEAIANLFSESLAADAMAKLASLLEVVGDEAALTERLAEFKGTPAAPKLRLLLMGIGADVVELQVHWASPKPGAGGVVSVNETQARDGITTITRMRPDEPSEYWVEGRFSEAGDDPPTFHFIEDGPEPRMFGGRVDDDARAQVAAGVVIRTTRYAARIKETVETNFENDIHRKYRLMEIRRLDERPPAEDTPGDENALTFDDEDVSEEP